MHVHVYVYILYTYACTCIYMYMCMYMYISMYMYKYNICSQCCLTIVIITCLLTPLCNIIILNKKLTTALSLCRQNTKLVHNLFWVAVGVMEVSWEGFEEKASPQVFLFIIMLLLFSLIMYQVSGWYNCCYHC